MTAYFDLVLLIFHCYTCYHEEVCLCEALTDLLHAMTYYLSLSSLFLVKHIRRLTCLFVETTEK